MGAPIWQYVVMMAFFVLGFFMNIFSVGVMAHLEKSKPEALNIENPELSFVSMLFKTLLGLFSAYVSYSLYVWSPGTLSLGILVVHWSSLVVSYIVAIANAGKTKRYSYGHHTFAIAYTFGMIVALITYGVKWL